MSNSTIDIGRRNLLKAAGIAAGSTIISSSIAGNAIAQDNSTEAWNAGDVKHIIPTANADRFLIKVSFHSRQKSQPYMAINGRKIPGKQSDPIGRFWQFDITDLKPDTQYKLQLVNSGGTVLCDSWPLKTFPAHGSMPEKVRILAYTCAGGDDNMSPIPGKTSWLNMDVRKHFLAKAMSFEPDLVISNGDHIYWDMKTFLNKEFAANYLKNEFWPKYGDPIDYSRPMLSKENINTFLAICDYQISELYGVTLRSTPSFFITDDHDYFENDEYTNDLAVMPPDDYGLSARLETQSLYYPEFLPDANQPEWLQGADHRNIAEGSNSVFGTIRYGDLIEAVLYDCRRYADYKGNHAQLLPQWTEDWLINRTHSEDTKHFMHCPSLPFAYSSGKLGDWYPDALDAQANKLVLYKQKQGWQAGWFAQHQRLIKAISAQKKRTPLIVQGDFHASAAGSIHRSGSLDLSDNPVHVITSGALGTGDLGFPSFIRSIESQASGMIGVNTALPPTEKNGFTIMDITPEKITCSLYTWRPPQDVREIDTMKPTIVYEVPVKA
ncbi:alkaline phosphatase D family protein [Vibrio sp. VPAP30]|uniref:alkaline phosphatase D family protein n=1 Tax=Vibrio sp. VPAP30 TaxID=1647102 RepID=UPI000657B4B7|nr:alkaline phosphatase D family protein [Vibrio sp. VPAP30]KLN63419.1 LigA [Vibrio sp. VPAP30]